MADEEPGSAVVRNALRYWSEVSAGGVPTRRAIRPQAMPALLPHILWFDVQHDPLDFRYRLVGTAVRHRLDRDRTGQRLSEIPGQGPGSQIWQHLAQVVRDRAASRRAPPFVGPGSDYLEIENLVCPLSDDGARVDGILVFVDFVPRRAEDAVAKVVNGGPRP